MSSIAELSRAAGHPDARLMGSECEYNLQTVLGSPIKPYIGPEAVQAAGINFNNNYLGMAGSAGKLYVDINEHPEFASAESLGPASAGVEDIHGIQILKDVVRASGLPHAGLYRTAGTYIAEGIRKNGVNTTSGHHKSFLVDRSLVQEQLLDDVLPGLLATMLWAMGGTLREEGYVFSQKIRACGEKPLARELVRRTNHGQKPMVTIPRTQEDNDVIGNEAQARVEVRCVDPTQSLTISYLSFAAISLALRMVQHKVVFSADAFDWVSLKDPVRAAHAFAGDLSLTKSVETQRRGTISAVGVQDRFVALAHTLAMSDTCDLPADERAAIELWAETVDVLRASDPSKLDYPAKASLRLGFARRHQFIANDIPLGNIDNTNVRAMSRNIVWDRVLPEGPASLFWAHINSHDPIAADIRAYHRLYGLAGRAVLRGQIIDAQSVVASHVTNWSHIRVDGISYTLDDPYRLTLP